jgi:hypothetical protein
MVQLFSSGIPAAQVKLIEANRDRIQAWFDNTPQYHLIDAVHATGVKFPNFILCWGGILGVEKIAMNTQTMLTDYRTHAKHGTFIFWDVEPGNIQSCLSKIKIPEGCLQCGEKSDLSSENIRILSINTIPDSTSRYSLSSGSAVLSGKYCPKCKKSVHLASAAYQKEAHFLTVSLSEINTKAAYRAIVEQNAENMVPYFSVVAWQQVRGEKLLEALGKQRR